MCRISENAAGLRMARYGSTSTARPSTMRKPVGVFIHPFAITTNTPDSTPLSATRTPAAQCARGARRSHP
jgi:hypothetical protein